MPLYLYFLIDTPEHEYLFVKQIEHLLEQIALALKLFLEAIAILIIAVAAAQTFIRLLQRMEIVKHQQNWEIIRLNLGLTLALSLEFLLAADIVGTAISPSWDAILQLGAVTGIRTFLNFFLQREVNQLEIKTDRLGKKSIRS